MLSAGTYHKRVPKDRRKNLEYRRWILREADGNPAVQQALVEACRDDILFYINTFVWQFNPKVTDDPYLRMGPVITWDFQDRLLVSRDRAEPGILWCIENEQDLVIEKSRDMGASWFCLLALEWMWHFHPWNKFLAISRDEDMVDQKGEPKSLFWKVDHVHRKLPKWLMPAGYDPNRHRRKMVFENPENGSVLAGEATTAKAGVGDRCTAIFIDEFSQIKDDKQLRQYTADTTNCRIFNGTHVGQATEFYRLTVKPGMKKFVMHWTQHPQKGAGAYHWDADAAKVMPHYTNYQYPPDFNFVTDGKPSGGPRPGVRSPWYDKEVERRDDDREVAMNLDIDPVRSESIYFEPTMINRLKATVCCEPFWRGELHYDLERATPKELTPLKDGLLLLWANPVISKGRLVFPPGRYAAGADISQGTGATPSTLSVVDADTGIKVLEYASAHIKPEPFAALCVALCRLLVDREGETAFFGWEAAGPVGEVFGAAVIEHGYRRVYYREPELTGLHSVPSDKPGWYPAPKHKLSIISNYRAALSSGEMENRSARALDECLLFKYDGRGFVVHSEQDSDDDPSGGHTNHADRVIADALAWKMVGELGGRKAAAKKAEYEPPVMSFGWRKKRHEKADKRAWI